MRCFLYDFGAFGVFLLLCLLLFFGEGLGLLLLLLFLIKYMCECAFV